MFQSISHLFFDFGGTLDSDGVHSRTLFINCFKEQCLVDTFNPLDIKKFQDAYSYADRKIISEALVLNSSLAQMNLIFTDLIASYLEFPQEKHMKVKNAANRISEIQGQHLIRNLPILKLLKNKYDLQMGIVSNFSGNLELILSEFGMRELFDCVMDSYHTRCEKPQSRIFSLALESAGVQNTNRCIFIGDNIERDIKPAKSLGMKTILIAAAVPGYSCNPEDSKQIDKVIHTLVELPECLSC